MTTDSYQLQRALRIRDGMAVTVGIVIAKMAEEVKDPGSALPKILVGGSLAVMVLYLRMNVSFLAALTPEEMAADPELIAAAATTSVFGNAAGTAVVDAKGTPRNALYFISAWIGLLALSGAFELLIRFMMTIALYIAILAVLVGTQPVLALGAGGMLAAILVAGVITTGRSS